MILPVIFSFNFRHNFYLIPLLIFCFSLPHLAKAGADTTINCPSETELRLELALRKDKLVKLKSGLENFITGKAVGSLPLTALFKIDLSDKTVISQRIQELRNELAEANVERPQDFYIDCARSKQSLYADAVEVLALQRAIADIRLQFLTLPPGKTAAILHPQLEADTQAITVKQLQEEHSSALEEQILADKALAHIEQQELTEETGHKSELVSAQADLERTNSHLARLQVTWLADLEQEAGFYQRITEQLAEVSRFLIQSETSTTALANQYHKTVEIWRTLVDKTQKTISNRHTVALPNLPEYPEKILNDFSNTPEAQLYITGYTATKNFQQALLEKITARLQASVDLHYRVLLQSGEIRSQLLNQLLDKGDFTPLAISTDLLSDIRREFAIVPYRWSATFYLRLLDIRKNINHGWQGLAETAINISLLLLFLLIPFALSMANKHLSAELNQLQIELVRLSRTKTLANYFALAIQKIQPYVSWFLALLAVSIAQLLLSNTVFSELTLLLPYLRYYIYYRLFRQAMQCDFMWVNQQIRSAKLWGLRRRVDFTARLLGLSAFMMFSLLAIIESLIRRGLIYHIATKAMLYCALLVAMGFAYQWRKVIGGGLAKMIPGRIGQRLLILCDSQWGLLLCTPGLVFLCALFLIRQLGNWGSHFELTQRLAAEVFRYRLETAINKTVTATFTPPPKVYFDAFALSGITTPDNLLSPTGINLAEIQNLLSNWQQGSNTANSLAVVSHKGGGKSCLLDFLGQSLIDCQTRRLAITEKLLSKEQTLQFFNAALPLSLDKPAVTTERKTVILLDDVHNCFLSCQDGFKAYEVLLELINISPNHYFWCVTFDYFAWKYLNNIYAKQHCFGSQFILPPWSELAIKELILSAHNKTGFQLSYDEILQAVGSQNNLEHVSDIENRFFILLRQQSKGNPRLAVYLWLTSLRLLGNLSLHVGLPDESEIANLSNLPEDALFVFACIARHENLTLAQIVQASQLSEAVIKNMLALGMRLKLLDYDNDHVYRIAILYQYPLINYLQAKHCLYE
ncbi:MAG: hypothetical protein WC782_02125 [Methylococcaceae bacterium]|jgi:hypothetical protein